MYRAEGLCGPRKGASFRSINQSMRNGSDVFVASISRITQIKHFVLQPCTSTLIFQVKARNGWSGGRHRDTDTFTLFDKALHEAGFVKRS